MASRFRTWTRHGQTITDHASVVHGSGAARGVRKLLAGCRSPTLSAHDGELGVTCNEAVFRDARSERAADHRGQRTSHDDWPNRPVRVISTFAAGGTADILARIVADHLSTAFKQQFFVEVRAGAGGQIGIKTIVDSPDLYTIGIANISHLVLHPMSRADLGYDPKRDLANIADGRGLAGVAVGQPEERLQVAQGLR